MHLLKKISLLTTGGHFTTRQLPAIQNSPFSKGSENSVGFVKEFNWRNLKETTNTCPIHQAAHYGDYNLTLSVGELASNLRATVMRITDYWEDGKIDDGKIDIKGLMNNVTIGGWNKLCDIEKQNLLQSLVLKTKKTDGETNYVMMTIDGGFQEVSYTLRKDKNPLWTKTNIDPVRPTQYGSQKIVFEAVYAYKGDNAQNAKSLNHTITLTSQKTPPNIIREEKESSTDLLLNCYFEELGGPTNLLSVKRTVNDEGKLTGETSLQVGEDLKNTLKKYPNLVAHITTDDKSDKNKKAYTISFEDGQLLYKKQGETNKKQWDNIKEEDFLEGTKNVNKMDVTLHANSGKQSSIFRISHLDQAPPDIISISSSAETQRDSNHYQLAITTQKGNLGNRELNHIRFDNGTFTYSDGMFKDKEDKVTETVEVKTNNDEATITINSRLEPQDKIPKDGVEVVKNIILSDSDGNESMYPVTIKVPHVEIDHNNLKVAFNPTEGAFETNNYLLETVKVDNNNLHTIKYKNGENTYIDTIQVNNYQNPNLGVNQNGQSVYIEFPLVADTMVTVNHNQEEYVVPIGSDFIPSAEESEGFSYEITDDRKLKIIINSSDSEVQVSGSIESTGHSFYKTFPINYTISNPQMPAFTDKFEPISSSDEGKITQVLTLKQSEIDSAIKIGGKLHLTLGKETFELSKDENDNVLLDDEKIAATNYTLDDKNYKKYEIRLTAKLSAQTIYDDKEKVSVETKVTYHNGDKEVVAYMQSNDITIENVYSDNNDNNFTLVKENDNYIVKDGQDIQENINIQTIDGKIFPCKKVGNLNYCGNPVAVDYEDVGKVNPFADTNDGDSGNRYFNVVDNNLVINHVDPDLGKQIKKISFSWEDGETKKHTVAVSATYDKINQTLKILRNSINLNKYQGNVEMSLQINEDDDNGDITKLGKWTAMMRKSETADGSNVFFDILKAVGVAALAGGGLIAAYTGLGRLTQLYSSGNNNSVYPDNNANNNARNENARNEIFIANNNARNKNARNEIFIDQNKEIARLNNISKNICRELRENKDDITINYNPNHNRYGKRYGRIIVNQSYSGEGNTDPTKELEKINKKFDEKVFTEKMNELETDFSKLIYSDKSYSSKNTEDYDCNSPKYKSHEVHLQRYSYNASVYIQSNDSTFPKNNEKDETPILPTKFNSNNIMDSSGSSVDNENTDGFNYKSTPRGNSQCLINYSYSYYYSSPRGNDVNIYSDVRIPSNDYKNNHTNYQFSTPRGAENSFLQQNYSEVRIPSNDYKNTNTSSLRGPQSQNNEVTEKEVNQHYTSLFTSLFSNKIKVGGSATRAKIYFIDNNDCKKKKDSIMQAINILLFECKGGLMNKIAIAESIKEGVKLKLYYALLNRYLIKCDDGNHITEDQRYKKQQDIVFSEMQTAAFTWSDALFNIHVEYDKSFPRTAFKAKDNSKNYANKKN